MVPSVCCCAAILLLLKAAISCRICYFASLQPVTLLCNAALLWALPISHTLQRPQLASTPTAALLPKQPLCCLCQLLATAVPSAASAWPRSCR